MIQSGSIYHITNAKSGTALNLSETNNVSVVGWPSHDGDNQKWRLDRLDGGLYTLRSVRTGQCVGLAGPVTNSARLVAVDYEFKWDIRPDEQDSTVYRFLVPDTTFHVDMSDFGNPDANTTVETWGKWEGRNQCWVLRQL